MAKFKKLISMALLLCLCTGLLPSTAYAAGNAISDKDRNELQVFFASFYFGWNQTYDFRNISTKNGNILQALIGEATPYSGPVPGGSWDTETNWYESDPLGKWDAYHKKNATQIEWILANVFNCSQTDISDLRSSLSASANGEYYLDGYYYSPAFGIGGGFNAVITDITPYEDYFFVTYDVRDLEGFGGDLINHCFAVVQRKTIEGTGTGYWSLYYYKVLAEGETIDLPSVSTPAPAVSTDNFTDVKQSDYFYNAVLWGVEQGIVAGSGANTFSPNDTCTKAQILTFLWRANGSPEPAKSNPFTDVSENRYYYKAAVWANEKGMVYPETFGADEPCTRAMTVTYLWKLAGSPVVEGNTFSDVPSSADYASAVLWAVDKGITSGTGGTAFSPNAVCTRAQIITFLYRNAGYETAVKPDLTSNEAEKDEGWKNAYIKLLREQYYTIDPFGSPMEIYKLVDVNGDDIPELYIETGITAAGSSLCTYYNGSVVECFMYSYGFSYIEGKNLFMDSGGHMDGYYDTIYSIVDGKFVEQCSGEYGAEDNTNVQYDANGEPIYKYYWDGTQVSSKAEYQKLLNNVFNEQRAADPFDGATYDSNLGRYVGNGLCNLEEIIDAISKY